MGVFEDRMARKIFGPKREEVTVVLGSQILFG
jgi:hypothetical protein